MHLKYVVHKVYQTNCQTGKQPKEGGAPFPLQLVPSLRSCLLHHTPNLFEDETQSFEFHTNGKVEDGDEIDAEGFYIEFEIFSKLFVET